MIGIDHKKRRDSHLVRTFIVECIAFALGMVAFAAAIAIPLWLKGGP